MSTPSDHSMHNVPIQWSIRLQQLNVKDNKCEVHYLTGHEGLQEKW